MTTQPPTLGPDFTVRGLNVYAGPGNSYDRVKVGGRAVFIEGGSHAILGKDADTAIWYQIRINNMVTGWIRAAFVQTHGNLDSLSVDQTLPRLSRVASTAARLNVYTGPGTNHSGIKVEGRLFFIDDASKYLIEGKDADTPTWYQIRVNDTVTGWINATQVQTHGDLSKLPLAWLPPLPADSLKLPVWKKDDNGKKIGNYRISGLFNDPRRWWRPEDGVPLRHEGIDWACGANKDVHAMAGGTVIVAEDDASHLLGKHVTVASTLNDGRAFQLTYVHLSTVADSVKDENGKPVTVNQGDQLGTSGNTGRYTTGAHLHVHYDPEGNVNWLDFFQYRNYQDFHTALPVRIYHWPDIAALQAKIDATTAGSAERETLIGDIDKWMDSLLQGTYGPRLWVKAGAKVYMFPRVDENYAYPCRPTPGIGIVAKDQAVWNLSHSLLFDDAPPAPEWWQIKGNSFPACWVRHEDTEAIENGQDVPLVSPSLLADRPRYLKKDNSTNVRRHPRTDKIENGQPVPEKAIDPRPAIAGWVPIVDLACDAITGDYLWYKIPYRTPGGSTPAGRSNAMGWVRGDVVDDLRGPDPDGTTETLAFPKDDRDVIKPKVPADDTTPQASTGPDQTVEAHIFPDRGSPAPRGFVLQLYLLQFKLLPTIVAALGHPLVTAAPVGPGQDAPHPARHAQDQAPQQAPDLGQAQPPARPRARLKAARLCVGGLFFWGCGRSRSAARTTASRARAHSASVTCRYQPCALRTS